MAAQQKDMSDQKTDDPVATEATIPTEAAEDATSKQGSSSDSEKSISDIAEDNNTSPSG